MTHSNPILEVEELAQDASTAMVIATLAQNAAAPVEVTDGRLYTTVDAAGNVTIVETPGYTDNHNDLRAARPRTVERSVTLLDVPSFVNYLARNTDLHVDNPGMTTTDIGTDHLHSDGSLELWADLDGRRILGILDGSDGWRRHQATLKLTTSREWDEWMAIDGKLLDQVKFAEFVEDHLSTIGAPDGGTILDITQTLQATGGSTVRQQHILATGQRAFRYEETVEAKAGVKGDLKVPGELTLVLRPFQGSDPISVPARLRFRVGSQGLSIGVKLSEPHRVLENAFELIVSQVQTASPVLVTYGRP